MTKTTKGNISAIRKMFDEITCKYVYEIIIEIEEEPELTLGEAEIKQK
jgi:hypothetical protein